MSSARRGGTGSAPPAVLSLSAELSSVRAARTFVQTRGREVGLDAGQCDDALLLTSELVTNAVLHGRSDVGVEVTTRGHRLRVAVVDENSRHPVRVTQDPNALDGRGLALVAALAETWGVEERPMGKAVWFELSRS